MPLIRLLALLVIVIAAAALTVWVAVSLMGGDGSMAWLIAIPVALVAALAFRSRPDR